jgi:hypothetical protein
VAASVEGVFRLIDRASGPLRRIEAQAKKTEAALAASGESMDDIGNRRQLRQLDETDRKMRNVGRESKVLDRNLDRTRRTMRSTTRETDGMSGALRKLAGSFAGLRSIAKPALFLGLLSAIRPLVSVVSALAGGVAALVPKLTDLAGVAGALPATFIGIGGAVAVAKLAFADLGKALGGNKNAIKALTPEGRHLLRTLKQYQPVLKDLRREAQRGLFPGIEYSIRRLQRAVPMVRRLIGRMSREMGSQAKLWANFLTSGNNLRDFERLGNQGVRIFRRISQGARNIAAALIDIASAARPFTEWLTKTLLRGTRQFRDFIDTQRRNGGLTRFFERTRVAVQRFWSILTHVGSILNSIMRAARPLGEALWRAIDRVTGRWADFLKSGPGQERLRRWFASLYPVIQQVAGLFSDIAQAFGRLAGPRSMGAAATFVGKLRDWVPIIEDILKKSSAIFGPSVIDAITTFGRLFSNLVGAGGGPVAIFLQTLTTVATAVNDLMDKFPTLGAAIIGAFAVWRIARLATRIVTFITTVGELAGAWRAVAGAAEAAAIAQSGAMRGGPTGGPGGGGGGAPVGGGGGGGTVVTGGGGRRSRFGRLRAAYGQRVADRTILAGGGGMSAAARAEREAALFRLSQPGPISAGLRNARAGSTYGLARSLGRGRAASTLAQLGAGAGGAKALALRAPGALARGLATGPGGLAAMIGGSIAGSQLESHGHQTAGGIVSGAATGAGIGAMVGTLVPIPGIGTAAGAGIGAVLGGGWGYLNARGKGRKQAAARIGDQEQRFAQTVEPMGENVATEAAAVRKLRAETKRLTGMKVDSDEERQVIKDSLTGLNAELKLRRENLRAVRHQDTAIKNMQSREKAKNVLVDLGHAFDIWAKKRTPEKAMQETVNGALGKIRHMRPAGARIVAENTLAWAKEQAKSNPKFQKEVERLERGILRSFRRTNRNVQIVNGQILTGSRTEWGNIADALITQTERAKQETEKGFTAMQEKAIGSLQAMGFDKANARRIVRTIQHGGRAGSLAKWQAANPSAPAATSPGLTQSRPGDGLGVTGRAPHTGGPIDGGPPVAPVAATTASTAPTGGSGGGLMGANQNLAPYASLGAQYGLHVSSGLRPGAITSSGNTSWHASGHAIDVSGPSQGMLQFFRAMKSRYGAGLEELIHTPGGQGIKNGVPYTYTGQVAADHYDHVHVADKDPGLSGGAVGPGALMQMAALQAPGAVTGGLPGEVAQTAMDMYAAGLTAAINQSLGAGMTPDGTAPAHAGMYDLQSLQQLWVAAGGPAGVAPLMARIAMAESGGNPSIGNAGRTPNGTTVAAGLWQILGLPFPGDPTDPMTNARMAVAKYTAGGTAPWNASKGTWGDGLGTGPGGGDFVFQPRISLGGGGGVAPQGRSGGGVMNVAINIHGGSNVEAQVQRALVKVARELDMVPMEDG